jgi:hypothetical protein
MIVEEFGDGEPHKQPQPYGDLDIDTFSKDGDTESELEVFLLSKEYIQRPTTTHWVT